MAFSWKIESKIWKHSFNLYDIFSLFLYHHPVYIKQILFLISGLKNAGVQWTCADWRGRPSWNRHVQQLFWEKWRCRRKSLKKKLKKERNCSYIKCILSPLTPIRGMYVRFFALSILSKRRPKPKAQLQKIVNWSYSLRDIAKIRPPSSQLFELSKFVYHSQSPKRPLEDPTGLFW